MTNAAGKHVDTTRLSIDTAEERGFIHRDYIAHCLRWSHVVKFLYQKKRHQTAHVLDVGCGKELPLAKMLYSSRLTHTTGSYTGVDYGKIDWPRSIPEDTDKFNGMLYAEADFVTVELDRAVYDVIVCFEVAEHVEPYHTFKLLERINQRLAPDGTGFISTPCYDPHTGAAANHVNEMSFHAFRSIIWAAGLEVKKVHGTFASQKDYKAVMDRETQKLFDKMGEYYDSQLLSCIFAPLFPEQSRNCLWQVCAGTRNPQIEASLFAQKHSSSTQWAVDLRKINDELRKSGRVSQ